MSLKAKVEAVLFVTAKPIKAQSIARIVNADVQLVRQALLELVHDYEERKGGLEIADEDGYTFQVRDEYANLMDEFLPVEMTAALIRTLSAIAIKQPISQSEIIRVRGAGAYEHIRELVSRDLVAKREEPQGGRSPMLSTTKKFQEYFRLTKDGKDLRNYLKRQVRKANAAEVAAEGQLAISSMVPEIVEDDVLNSRIYLETALMAEEAAAADESDKVTSLPMPEDDWISGDEAPAASVAQASQPVESEFSAAPVAEAAHAIASEVPAASVEAPHAISSVPETASVPAETIAAAEEKATEAAGTLSRLAAAAAKPEEASKADDEVAVPPSAAESRRSNVQASTAKGGPPTGNSKKKKPPQLSDLLEKQKLLEQSLKRVKTEDVQTAIDFNSILSDEKQKPSDTTH